MSHQFIKTLMEDQKRINICLEECIQKRLMQLSEHYAADVFDPLNDILQNSALPAKKVSDIAKRFGSVENAAAWVCGIASIVFPQHEMLNDSNTATMQTVAFQIVFIINCFNCLILR
jgi:hypothetical protein